MSLQPGTTLGPYLSREPLVHFLVLGLCFFAVYALVNDESASETDTSIVVAQSDIDWLEQNFVRQWNRPPSATELEHLIDAHVREEVLYREALSIGLDENDTIVRRRLAQKLEFLAEDLAARIEPTDAELEAYFVEHRTQYELPLRLSFTHVYFNSDRRENARADAEYVLAELEADAEPPSRAPERGDRFMLQHDYPNRSSRDVEQTFGRGFAEALFQLGAEVAWQGPIASSYGYHLVRVTNRAESLLPELTAVTERVRQDFEAGRRERANEAYYESLLARYDVTIEDTPEKGDEPPALAAESRREP